MTSPPALAFVITGLEPGGAERALTQLALRIDRKQFQPHVFALRTLPGESQRELIDQLAAAEIPFEFLGSRTKLQFPGAVWRLSRRLSTLRPALVQSFLFHANVVSAYAGKWSGVKVVAGVRVADPSRVRQRAERWISPLVERFVCVSQSVADYCERSAKIPRAKLAVIPNGVDVAKFRDAPAADRAALGLPAERRFLIAVGRLDKQKGHDWLLPLLPRIFAERPEYDLLLVGDGPLRASLQQQAKELGVEHRIHFLGWQANVPALLKLAELLLLPSRWEGMPNVLLEAMAAALPVVTTRVEGAEEILGSLAEQQMTEHGDGAAFQNQVLAMTASAGGAEGLGRANQLRVEEHFSLAVMAKAYGQLYCQIINS